MYPTNPHAVHFSLGDKLPTFPLASLRSVVFLFVCFEIFLLEGFFSSL